MSIHLRLQSTQDITLPTNLQHATLTGRGNRRALQEDA